MIHCEIHTHGDKMSVPTRLRLVILGIFSSIIFVLNECVSTLFTLSLKIPMYSIHHAEENLVFVLGVFFGKKKMQGV